MKTPAWFPTGDEVLHQLAITAVIAGLIYLVHRACTVRTPTN